jgi:nucleoside-diphosphate-sugar epimerase
MTKKVLITGGTGFLGVHLTRYLLKKKYKVTLLDSSVLDAKDLIGKVRVLKGDIRDTKTVDKAMAGQDYVVHAAAALPIQLTKQAIFSVNIEGTKKMYSHPH